MKIILFCLLVLTLSAHCAQAAYSPEAQKLLLNSDRARGGLSAGLEWDVVITTNQNSPEKEATFHVKVKGASVLAFCTAPARQKGETYLFNDRNLWIYRSNLRKPISVSTRLRLSGQTSNGDIATTNYAKDYEAEILVQENVGDEKTTKLLLKAKSKDLTYDQIHYWISEKTGLAVQADFLTMEGKPIKRANYTYDNTIKIGDKTVPFISKMVITETLFPQNQSILTYKNLKNKSLSDGLFNVNNLAR